MPGFRAWIAPLLVGAMAANLGGRTPVQASAAAPRVQFATLPSRTPLAPMIPCARLEQQRFDLDPQAPARVLSASIEPNSPGRAEFCLVKGYVSPTIEFELRLPTAGYTGRYLQGGCGGNCGYIATGFTPSCTNAVAYSGAFAVGFQNSGHRGSLTDGVWAISSAQAREDFAHRAAHVFSIAAKSIIRAYYGADPDYSYFQGCSGGGREAMMETQRYPHDFDGVIAGAAPYLISEKMERYLWEARVGTDSQGRSLFDVASARVLHGAVMAACDSSDGLTDGQIDDPRRCRFDPSTLVCSAGETSQCLTPAQAESARKLYEGPVDSSGKHLYLGGAPYGSELVWPSSALAVSGRTFFDNFVRAMVYHGELPQGLTFDSWKFNASSLDGLAKRGAIYQAADADLRAFRQAGGKLILWQGAADPAAGSYAYVDYYRRVREAVGGMSAAREFVRLFEVPATYHCSGGYIAYQGDILGTMVRWVETGEAPDKIVFSALLESGVQRDRPVFAYPGKARYKGRGDVNAADSFALAMPSSEPSDRYDWLGAR